MNEGEVMSDNTEEKVVSLADKREQKSSGEISKEEKSDFDFEAVMKANKEKADKLKKDRDKANTSVKRSYRLTPKK
jgi:hypothetical protein